MSCWCKENKENTWKCNCKLEWRWEANVFMLDEETRVVDVPHDPIVVSTDNTVSIDVSTESYEDWTRPVYDLSVQCCDSKVSVCVWDTNPWVLRDKIDVSWALTIDVDCGDKITIWLNEALLPIQPEFDEKVARQNWCEWKYLDDLIWLTDEFEWVNWTNPLTATAVTDNCEKRYIWRKCVDCLSKSIAKIRLRSDFIDSLPVNQPLFSLWFYWLVSDAVSSSFVWVPVTSKDRNWATAWWTSELNIWWIVWDVEWKICNTCPHSRLVRARRKGNIEASWWINGLRCEIWMKDWVNLRSVAERRDSPTSDPDVSTPPDWLPDNYFVTSWWPQANRLNAWYKYQERQNFDAEEVFWLPPWACLIPVVKVSAFIDDNGYDQSKDANFSVLWRLATDWSVSWDLWAFFEVETIDDPCMIRQYQEECDCQ